MEMKTSLIRVPFVIVAFSAIWHIALAALAVETTTTAPRGKNLEEKMFTLSDRSGGISFFPSYSMLSTNELYTTQSYTTSTTWTPAVGGVSVCWRYLTDSQSIQQFFRLGSDSGHSLYLDLQDTDTYGLRLSNQYNTLYLKPNKIFVEGTSELWTSVCFTVDNRKRVAQVFSGSKMSIRKLMPGQMVWSGEPVIEFSAFNGQLTDVQVWDYPIPHKDVLRYMYRDYYGPQKGSVLTWSSINYSLRGNALLEDSYEKQLGGGGRLRMQKKLFLAEKRLSGKNQLL